MGILQCHVSFQTCICVKTSLKTGSGLGDFCSSQNWPVPLGECVVIRTCESFSFPKTKMCPETSSSWWFQRFFIFTITWGRWSNLTNTFQMGWNHQLAVVGRLNFLSFWNPFWNPGSTSYSGFTSAYGWSEPYSLSGGVVGQEFCCIFCWVLRGTSGNPVWTHVHTERMRTLEFESMKNNELLRLLRDSFLLKKASDVICT